MVEVQNRKYGGRLNKPLQPAPKPLPPKLPTTAPASRVRVERIGNGEYRVIEETFTGPPSGTKVLKANVDKVSAEYEVRLYLERWLGVNRLGDSGL